MLKSRRADFLSSLRSASHDFLIRAGWAILKRRELLGPWRVIVSTNDYCNYQCVMCYEHSPLAPFQYQNKGAGVPSEERTFDELK